MVSFDRLAATTCLTCRACRWPSRRAWKTLSSTDVIRRAWRMKTWLGVLWLSDHADFKCSVNLYRHVSRARRTQPEVFIDAGVPGIFQFRMKPASRERCFGVDQKEFPFAETAKLRATARICAFRKHAIVERLFAKNSTPVAAQTIRPET